jgi:sigma-B regulation protein RsbU (phosphoserine phosphatase)
LWLDDKLQYLDKGTTLLGFLDQLPFIEVNILEFNKTLFLFSYTDGFTDFFDEFNIDLNEITKFISKYKHLSPLEIKKHIINWINKLQSQHHTLKDDLALLIIQCSK